MTSISIYLQCVLDQGWLPQLLHNWYDLTCPIQALFNRIHTSESQFRNSNPHIHSANEYAIVSDPSQFLLLMATLQPH